VTRLEAHAATDPGRSGHPNEDHHIAGETVVVLADGATSRTDTGCEHGVAWFAQTLCRHLAERARHAATLRGALADAIEGTAADHPGCDLTHPGSPSATVGIVRAYGGDAIEWLVLGDVHLIIDTDDGLQVHSQSVDHIGQTERDAATALPIGHPERDRHLVAMKHAMNAQRNTDGGYWVAAADRRAAYRVASGIVPTAAVRRMLLLSDGAAALAEVYAATDAAGLLDLAEAEGPETIIKQVRAIEEADPTATAYPRTKASDDATAIAIAVTA
jgi:hypothetical protein